MISAREFGHQTNTYTCCRVHVMAFSVVPSRSGVVRTFQQRTLLEVTKAHAGRS
jgi:hypothetical protein